MLSKRVNIARYLSKVWGWDSSEANPVADGGTLGGHLGGTL